MQLGFLQTASFAPFTVQHYIIIIITRSAVQVNRAVGLSRPGLSVTGRIRPVDSCVHAKGEKAVSTLAICASGMASHSATYLDGNPVNSLIQHPQLIVGN